MQSHEVVADRPVGIRPYSWYALAVLTTVYVLNFLDRQLIYTLFPLLGKEMSFTDTQLAMLGTLPFVIFYTVLGIPFGRLADRRSRKVIIAFAGYALIGLASNNIGIWLTQFYVRVHELTLAQIGAVAGIVSLAVGVPAMILGGYFADRISRRLPGGRLAFTSIVAILSVPLWIAFLFADRLAIVVPVNIALYALAIMWVGPATADVTEIAGPSLRGLAIGVFFSIVNLTAYAIGSPLIGKVSDLLGVKTNPEQMRYSLLVCPIACALGALLLWMGSRARARA